MASIFPENEGYLPYWILLASVLAIFNSLQNFLTLSLTKRVYSAKPHEGNININFSKHKYIFDKIKIIMNEFDWIDENSYRFIITYLFCMDTYFSHCTHICCL